LVWVGWFAAVSCTGGGPESHQPGVDTPSGDRALAFTTGGYADTNFNLDTTIKERSHSITFRAMFQYPNSFQNDVIASTSGVYAISKPEAPSSSHIVGHTLALRMRDAADMYYVFNVTDVPRARWINVAMTVEKPLSTGALYLIKIYVDGVLQASGALESASWGTLGRLRLGSSAPGQPPSQFYGLLDNVAVWNRVLSPTEIAALSHNRNRVNGDEAGLLAAWIFDRLVDAPPNLNGPLTLAGGADDNVHYVTVTGEDRTDALALPEPRHQTVLSTPLDGPWRVIQGIDSDAPGSHRGYASFSIDFVNYEGRAGSFGHPIRAAADGQVVFFRDTSPDGDRTVPDCIPCPLDLDDSNEGQCLFESNEILLSHDTAFNEPGEYSFYEHLRRGSIPASVKNKWLTGEPVRRGEILGETGESGNVGDPQLHFSYYWYVRVPPAFDLMYPRTDNRKAGCGYFPAVPPPTRVITRPFALANYYDYLDGAGPMVFRPQGTPALKDAVSATPFSP
jgi:murein DD-endopeptidase MepM/ murein hydrolase activator NlpD